ncbi:hypothetical protein E8E13_007558 [Curvularia kusanoi]|uniref:Uncharacterized protein n=1 Tax=Curvularia kusanoi TaxID=90978 RepID=A0A9P4TPP8_CURKU|nr:hypothetical protein E8E13_007558 [Curvularia kusanoi]
MAGILVMGIALGLQEGGKKIKEKRNERKAKKAALAAVAYTPTESSSSGAVREAQTPHRRSGRDKSQEARRDQERRNLSSERIFQEDAPPSYEEVPRPTYEEAVRVDQHAH